MPMKCFALLSFFALVPGNVLGNNEGYRATVDARLQRKLLEDGGANIVVEVLGSNHAVLDAFDPTAYSTREELPHGSQEPIDALLVVH